MQLDPPYPTIEELHVGNPFQFPLAPDAELSSQTGEFTDAATDGDGFYVGDLTDDLEIHRSSTVPTGEALHCDAV